MYERKNNSEGKNGHESPESNPQGQEVRGKHLGIVDIK